MFGEAFTLTEETRGSRVQFPAGPLHFSCDYRGAPWASMAEHWKGFTDLGDLPDRGVVVADDPPSLGVKWLPILCLFRCSVVVSLVKILFLLLA